MKLENRVAYFEENGFVITIMEKDEHNEGHVHLRKGEYNIVFNIDYFNDVPLTYLINETVVKFNNLKNEFEKGIHEY